MEKILKIIVTGPFSAGKSAFVKTVSEIKVVATERKITTQDRQIKAETTVAMDFGRLDIAGTTLHLFGTPGQPRFDFMWEILAKEMDGFVVLVDSCDPDRFVHAKGLIGLFTDIASVPFIVAANKQDMPGALKPRRIREALKLSPDVLVLPCSAINQESVHSVLVQLKQAVKWEIL